MKLERKFFLNDLESGGSSYVYGEDIFDVMSKYLPWQYLNLECYHDPRTKITIVIDTVTDFKYEILDMEDK